MGEEVVGVGRKVLCLEKEIGKKEKKNGLLVWEKALCVYENNMKRKIREMGCWFVRKYCVFRKRNWKGRKGKWVFRIEESFVFSKRN